MKVKRGKTVSQVTFGLDKHPSTGSVFTLTWGDLVSIVEKGLEIQRKKVLRSKAPIKFEEADRVLSFKVTENGLDVYHENIMSVGDYYEFRDKLTK